MCFGSCCRKRRRENNRVYPASESTTPETTRPTQPIMTQPKPLPQTSAPSFGSTSQPRAGQQYQQNQSPYVSQTSGILKESKKTVYESVSGPGRKSITETVIEDKRTITTKPLNDSGASRSSTRSSGKQVCDAEEISPERVVCEEGGTRSICEPGSRGVSMYSSTSRKVYEPGSRGVSMYSSTSRKVYEQGRVKSVCEPGRGRSACEAGGARISPGSRGASMHSGTSKVCEADSRSVCETYDTAPLTTKTSVCDVRETTLSSENIHRAMSKGSNIMDLGDFDGKCPSRKISAMQAAGSCPGRGREPKILDKADTCPQAQNFKSFTDCQKLRVADDSD